MYTTSTDFKTVINNPSRKFECKVICSAKTYTNVNIVSINITGSLQPSGYTIGSAISQKATFKFINDGTVTFPSNVIELQIGLLVNGSYEYIPIGSYTIDSHDSDDYTITITAYDNMTKFEGKYNGTGTTLQAIAQEICTACGVTLGSTIPATTVTTPASGKYTNREVIGYIAGCCCGNAVIDRNGTLKIQKLNLFTIDKQVTTENWFTYKNADNKFDIDEIICDTGSKEKLTSGSVDDIERQLTVKNPLMTQAMLDNVRTELSNTVFYGFDVKYQGDISTDLGDTVNVVDRKGQTLISPILQRTLNYNGGLTENIKTEGKKKVDLASSYYANGRYGLDMDKYYFDMQDFKYQMQDFNKSINIMGTSITDLQNKIKTLEEVDNRFVSIYVINTALVSGGSIVGFNANIFEENSLTDWGDGTINNATSHTYNSVGIYTIKTNYEDYLRFRDDLPGGNHPLLVEIVKLTEKLEYARFCGCENLEKVGDCLGLRFGDYTFKNCTKLKYPANVSDKLVSAIEMYKGCTSLEDTGLFPINLKDAGGMFSGCKSLEFTGNMNNKIEDANRMFYCCTNLKKIGHLSTSLKNAEAMFAGCTGLDTELIVLPDSIDNAKYMFSLMPGTIITTNLPTSLKNAEDMFSENSGNDKQLTITNDIADCKQLENCNRMFQYCNNLNVNNFTKLPSTAILLDSMFMGCTYVRLPIDFINNQVQISAPQMFVHCMNITEMNVPAGIPGKVQNYTRMFAESGIIVTAEYTGNITDNWLEGMYAGCASLTTISASLMQLMQANPTAKNGSDCFEGCTNITNPDTYSNLHATYPSWF